MKPAHLAEAATMAAGMIAALGVRSTPARVDVLAVLLAAGEALSHHDVEDRLRGRHAVDRVTLYRVLEWLVERDLAHKLAGDDRVWRFSASLHAGGEDGAPREHAHGGTFALRAPVFALGTARRAHAHFRCVDCGRIVCLADAGVPALAVPAGYRSDEVEVTVKGHCDRCAG